jgi:hypothetical protein
MSEYDEAQAWALRRRMTAYDLAERTGYSYEAIRWFWRGLTPPGRNLKSGSKSRKIRPHVWQRFKMACAAVESEIKGNRKFNW